MSEQNSDRAANRQDAWAEGGQPLQAPGVPKGAMNLNVEGRHLTGPLQGFGRMWEKTYRVPLHGANVTPAQVIRRWKDNFPKYWPRGNRFYAPLTRITPGEVAVLNLEGPAGLPVSTGIAVIYADDESFAFMTPEGHMFAALITFSAHEEEGTTIAQTLALIRPNDPFYEFLFRLGVLPKMEDQFWCGTMQALARDFGVEQPVQINATLVDPRLQWKHAANLWQNAAIRSALYRFAAPVRWAAQRVRGVKTS